MYRIFYHSTKPIGTLTEGYFGSYPTLEKAEAKKSELENHAGDELIEVRVDEVSE